MTGVQTCALPISAVPTPGLAPAAAPRDDVLVVDEGHISGRALQRHLQLLGFRTELAGDTEGALQQLGERAYRFVLVDERVGRMDGLQLSRAIRRQKTPRPARPVVVLMTSRRGLLDRLRAWLAGCTVSLAKPLNEADLVRLLARHESRPGRRAKA